MEKSNTKNKITNISDIIESQLQNLYKAGGFCSLLIAILLPGEVFIYLGFTHRKTFPATWH